MNQNYQKVVSAVPEHYGKARWIAEQAGLSYSTTLKYLRMAVENGDIKRCDIGIYSPSWRYFRKTGD